MLQIKAPLLKQKKLDEKSHTTAMSSENLPTQRINNVNLLFLNILKTYEHVFIFACIRTLANYLQFIYVYSYIFSMYCVG